jgi:hypothetical protein
MYHMEKAFNPATNFSLTAGAKLVIFIDIIF